MHRSSLAHQRLATEAKTITVTMCKPCVVFVHERVKLTPPSLLVEIDVCFQEDKLFLECSQSIEKAFDSVRRSGI